MSSQMGKRLSCVVMVGVVALTGGAEAAWAADPVTITVKVDQPGVKISPTLYGLMTEEINHSYDGGLYAELIQNRTFQDIVPPPAGPRRNPNNIPPLNSPPTTPPEQPLHWSVVKLAGMDGGMALDTAHPVSPALPYSLRLDISSKPGGGSGMGPPRVGVANDGFWGIPVKPNTEYRASFYARRSADFPGPLTVDIESNDGTKLHASGRVPALTTAWKKYEVTLKTGEVAASKDNRFVISAGAGSSGSVWLSLVSLMPPTYNNRPNGLRPDLMELLQGMKPAFLRFPGGNYLQGEYFNERFDWKATLGPLEQRPGHMTPWRYRSSDGMGLLEYLEWCEDLKMEPVVGVFAGFALKLQGVSAGPDLEPYVREALEEIEYITGGPETKWGQARAKDGHPAPFKLRYVEIGNEDSFDNVQGRYDGRFTQFFDAIKGKYPDMQVIATKAVTNRKPDVLDDHYYRPPEQMAGDAHHYDKYDRTGPKIMVGEYASREAGPARTLTPTLRAALGDAAWLTGLERNSDLVIMSCYAPLLVNVNPGASQWVTDLIGYDALGSFGSPSYYVVKMFAENRGDVVLPVEWTDTAANAPAADGRGAAETLFVAASQFLPAGAAAERGEVVLKLVNTGAESRKVSVKLQGVRESAGGWAEVLTGDPGALNSIAEPAKIAPKREPVAAGGATMERELPGSSVSVIRLRVR
jgi:alpha-L-arabinofuranosidase